MRSLPLLSLLCAAAPLGCGGPEPAPRRSGSPNLVWIVIDTLRADHLGCYGHAGSTSPSIDALAARSVLFETAYAQAPWTKPSVASMLSSLPPRSHGVVREGIRNRLPESVLTLPEVLAAEGFACFAFTANPHVRAETGFEQGFDELEPRDSQHHDAGWALRRGAEWLERRPVDRPFFLYLHAIDPHSHYQPEAETRERFLAGLAARGRHAELTSPESFLEDGELARRPTDDELAVMVALYDAEIAEVDAAVGGFLDALAEEGIADRTVVLLTSDHGESFLEHGTLKHGYQLYEELIRIPLLVRAPGIAPRRVSDAVAQHLDLAPTVLELLGVGVPPEFLGRSLVPALRGEPMPEAGVLSETQWRQIDRSGFRRGRFKLVTDARTGAVELYDVVSDPAERRDLAAERPELVAEMHAAAEELRAEAPAVDVEGAWGKGNERVKAMLAELGYLQDEAEGGETADGEDGSAGEGPRD